MTWESDPDVVQPTPRHLAMPGAVRVLCGMAGVTPWHYTAHSCPSSMPHPSKRDSDALERRMATNSVLAQDGAVT
jgi:hypothetical protein